MFSLLFSFTTSVFFVWITFSPVKEQVFRLLVAGYCTIFSIVLCLTHNHTVAFIGKEYIVPSIKFLLTLTLSITTMPRERLDFAN